MESQKKRLAILGSTGSVGRQTLDVVRALPEHFEVVGLAAGGNVSLLTQQVDEFHPGCVSLAGVPSGSSFHQCTVISLEEMAVLPEADIIVLAVSGTAGISAAFAAVRAGKTVGLANKESMVMAGELLREEAARSNAAILPVDSEHSAIWQCLDGEREAPRRIILTASGGPFRTFSAAEMEKVTVAQALAHPSWTMGKKITIDSATLLNKGLEIIEARWLFDVPVDDIVVLIHPQSIIHSMVEFIDGSTKAQLSRPDMRFAIQYALTYPDRLPNPGLPQLDWYTIPSLTFEPPDFNRFPCLQLSIDAARQGGTCPAVLCAAGEAAVQLFMEERIRFTAIAGLISEAMEHHDSITQPSLDDIIAAASWARDEVSALVQEDKRWH